MRQLGERLRPPLESDIGARILKVEGYRTASGAITNTFGINGEGIYVGRSLNVEISREFQAVLEVDTQTIHLFEKVWVEE